MEHIGDLLKKFPEARALAKAKPLQKPKLPSKTTPQTEKFLAAALEISKIPDKMERAFMARQLVQCTLPHSNPGNVPRWLRRNGTATLVLQAGWNVQKDCSYGYPFGVIPRLLMFWMVTEAVRTKQRRLELGRSLSAFMRELGLIPSSAGAGKRSDAKRLRDQMERLFGCRITFDVQASRSDGGSGRGWMHMEVSTKGEYWWNPKMPEQGALWGSWVELGEEFFKAVTEAPVPVDMRALRLLKRSPLALDLYTLATHKAFIANKYAQGQFLTWEVLHRQLGAEYDESRIRDFRAKAKPMFRRVSLAFPSGLKHEVDKTGVIFLPGTRLPVPPRASVPVAVR